MKLLLDTCVLYPTVMREVLLKTAQQGLFTPLWSARILEEWARAARKLGPTGEPQARGEIALVRADFPQAEVAPHQGLEQRLWLPDKDDVHVLAAAIAGNAEAIVTLNAGDFPRNVLSEEGLERIDPDSLMVKFFAQDPHAVRAAAAQVHAQAEALSGTSWEMRKLLKKARLPRLGKALSA